MALPWACHHTPSPHPAPLKALDLFNTAMVSPVYYVMFTMLTIVASLIMYRVSKVLSFLRQIEWVGLTCHRMGGPSMRAWSAVVPQHALPPCLAEA